MPIKSVFYQDNPEIRFIKSAKQMTLDTKTVDIITPRTLFFRKFFSAAFLRESFTPTCEGDLRLYVTVLPDPEESLRDSQSFVFVFLIIRGRRFPHREQISIFFQSEDLCKCKQSVCSKAQWLSRELWPDSSRPQSAVSASLVSFSF